MRTSIRSGVKSLPDDRMAKQVIPEPGRDIGRSGIVKAKKKPQPQGATDVAVVAAFDEDEHVLPSNPRRNSRIKRIDTVDKPALATSAPEPKSRSRQHLNARYSEGTEPIPESKPAVNGVKSKSTHPTSARPLPAPLQPLPITIPVAEDDGSTETRPTVTNIFDEPIGKKRALIIGIGYLGSDHELHNSANNACNMGNLFAFLKYDEVCMLTDRHSDPHHLDPNCPTGDNILKKLEDLARKTLPGDTLFVYYSGHGMWLFGEDYDENEGTKDEVMVSVDNQLITEDILTDILVDKLASGTMVRIVSDCYSNAGTVNVQYGLNGAGTSVGIKSQSPRGHGRDVLIIGVNSNGTAASANEYTSCQQNGALTFAFLTSIYDLYRTYSTAKWTWRDLFYSMKFKLARDGYKVTPCYEFSDRDLPDQPIRI